eukprot:7389337-Prymnesium_polylepis.1
MVLSGRVHPSVSESCNGRFQHRVVFAARLAATPAGAPSAPSRGQRGRPMNSRQPARADAASARSAALWMA